MNWDQIQGNWMLFKANVQGNWVKLTDEDLTRIGGRVHRMVAWAKLEALAQGAALASRTLWR